MKPLPAVLLASLLLIVPGQLSAKADTSKIIIESSDLGTPVEITDSKLLKDFFVWGELIVNPAKGAVSKRPPGLRRYQVSFYAKVPVQQYVGDHRRPRQERRLYVVFYEYDPATAQGYVYLPARGEQWYTLNVSTILRRVEGKWFHASKAWDKVAGPLVARPGEPSSR